MNLAHIHEPDADSSDSSDSSSDDLAGSTSAPSGRLRLALEAFLARESRAQGPEGEWREGLWFPSNNERRPCCEGLAPTLANKQALESHCRSAAHVAALFEVPVLDLRRALKRARIAQEAAADPSTGAAPARQMTNTERLARISRAALSEALATLRAEARQGAEVLKELGDLDEEPAGDLAATLKAAAERLKLVTQSLESAAQMELVCRVSELALGKVRALEQ
ncbi:MAG TPA: hypothetical protein VN851_06430 [Thermoanaerobaculia bacterium]|nr:hypothetical protein [Thermoanaerobaculia bacterium]